MVYHARTLLLVLLASPMVSMDGVATHPAAQPPRLAAVQNRSAIYWKGDLLVDNSSAAAKAQARGFTHALSSTITGAATLASAGLAPILLLSDDGNVTLRTSSPYLDAAAFRSRLQLLRDVLRSTPSLGISRPHGLVKRG